VFGFILRNVKVLKHSWNWKYPDWLFFWHFNSG